jgi:hypothetical protein
MKKRGSLDELADQVCNSPEGMKEFIEIQSEEIRLLQSKVAELKNPETNPTP